MESELLPGDIEGDVSRDHFVSVARKHRLISEADARRVTSECQDGDVSDFVLRAGIMDAIRVDAVATLCSPDDLAPNYHVDRLLGYGGMGVVYQAQQTNLSRGVALKTINLKRIQNENSIKRIELEAKVTARMRHPNIVNVFDSGVHRGRFYMAMELVDGEDLDSKLGRQGPMSPGFAWSIVRQVASALAHAEDEGIFHRDIKPGNLLLTKVPRGMTLPTGVPLVKVTDFGLAIQSFADNDARLTADGSALGTPIYAAPEQLRGTDIDCRADIYALGITLFQMITGRAPFAGRSPLDIIVTKTSGDESWRDQFPRQFTPETIDLFLDMTHFDRDNRIASYEQLFERIDKILNAMSGVATKPATVVADRQTDQQPHTMVSVLPSSHAAGQAEGASQAGEQTAKVASPQDSIVEPADTPPTIEHLSAPSQATMPNAVKRSDDPTADLSTPSTDRERLIPTDESPRTDQQTPSAFTSIGSPSRIRRLLLFLGPVAVMPLVLIVLIQFGVIPWPSQQADENADRNLLGEQFEQPAEIDYRRTRFLYNGFDTPNGRVNNDANGLKFGAPSGTWIRVETPEGYLLSTTDSNWQIDLAEEVLTDENAEFEFQLGLHVDGQSIAEVEFGVTAEDTDGERLVIHFAGTQVMLGTKSGPHEGFVPFEDVEAQQLRTADAGQIRLQELNIKRFQEGWSITVNGRQLGNVKHDPSRLNRLYRLVSRNGPVFFADVRLRD